MAREVDTEFNPAFQGPIDRMLAAAKARGITTHFTSGVRSYDDQSQLYANWLAGKAGKPLPFPDRGAVSLAAKPGTSLHEKGFAADIVADDPSRQAELRALGNQFGLKTLGSKDPMHFELGTRINAPNAPIAGALAKQETGPESAGQGTPAAASTGPLDMRQLIYNKLTAAGLQPHQAMGALYGLGGESATFNTGAYNPKDPGGSIGIGQWNRDRRTALEAFAKTRGTAVTDPNTQADFLVDELTNPKAATYQPGVLDAMKTAKDAAAATNTWVAKYERPKVNNWQERYDKGPGRVGSLDQNNNFALGSGPASNTTAAPAPAAADQPWWSRFVNPPADAQGKPVEGAKSPLEQAVATVTGGPSEKTLAALKAAAPQGGGLEMSAPGARNVSPGLAPGAIQQTWGQTLNSFMQPLTWGSAPPGSGLGPAAGYHPAVAGGAAPAVPGMSLTSVPYDPSGFQFQGYG